MNAPVEARQITRASKSNLALAFIALPPERRDDITIFYAWCRVIDDIADDPGQPEDERRSALDLWKQALREPAPGESELAPPVRALIEKYRLPIEHFLEIIAGVEMDLAGASYATWDELRVYCYRVASAVGLVSIEIFGCREPSSRDYAVSLGLALQLTNILRDVGEDWRNGGRVYLPREDLARFGCTVDDLAAGRRTPELLELMRFEAARARKFYAEALAARPAADRRALVAAEIMRAVYSRILARMERDDFDVFTRRYRLSAIEKLAIIAGTVVRSKFL
ncbi:MAG TPA: presqualene diphosphate synthase HpnD [Chthoniobacteraceae bacterium]|nr:presqualene diphosphate synthase HpnD [Chthoniobacteraceae bacterium]